MSSEDSTSSNVTASGADPHEREVLRANARREYELAIQRIRERHRELSRRETIGVLLVLASSIPIGMLFDCNHPRVAIGLVAAVALVTIVTGAPSRWLLLWFGGVGALIGAFHFIPAWVVCPLLIPMFLLAFIWSGRLSQQATEAAALERYGAEPFDRRDRWSALRSDLEKGVPVVVVLWAFAAGDPSPEDYTEVGDMYFPYGARYDNPVSRVINAAASPLRPYAAFNPRRPAQRCEYRTVLLDPTAWLSEVESVLRDAKLIVVDLWQTGEGLKQEIGLVLRNHWEDRCWVVKYDADSRNDQPYAELWERARWKTSVPVHSREDFMIVDPPHGLRELLELAEA